MPATDPPTPTAAELNAWFAGTCTNPTCTLHNPPAFVPDLTPADYTDGVCPDSPDGLHVWPGCEDYCQWCRAYASDDGDIFPA